MIHHKHDQRHRNTTNSSLLHTHTKQQQHLTTHVPCILLVTHTPIETCQQQRQWETCQSGAPRKNSTPALEHAKHHHTAALYSSTSTRHLYTAARMFYSGPDNPKLVMGAEKGIDIVGIGVPTSASCMRSLTSSTDRTSGVAPGGRGMVESLSCCTTSWCSVSWGGGCIGWADAADWATAAAAACT